MSTTPPTVAGPESYERDTRVPPTFSIEPGPGRFYSLEVAKDPALFRERDRRTRSNFFASWQTSGLLGAEAKTTTFSLPVEAWLALRDADSLYIRVLTTTSPTSWVDVQSSQPQDPQKTPRIRLHGRFTLGVESPVREEELLWRGDPPR